MKRPKCGSELDTGFNCPKCKAKSYKEIVYEYNTNGEKIYEKNTIKLVQPELTTAEMLLWLLKHTNFRVEAHDLGFYIKEEWGEEWYWFDTISQSEEEAIKAAYLKAKQEEQNAKN